MSRRLELHEILCNFIGITESDGDRHVYFQPPESVKLRYPAIVYSFDGAITNHADDTKYLQEPKWMVTVIDKNPESEIAIRVNELSMSSLDRVYKSDNLNHFSFTLYF